MKQSKAFPRIKNVTNCYCHQPTFLKQFVIQLPSTQDFKKALTCLVSLLEKGN